MVSLIRGMSYIKKQREYQLFPEDYYSGSDASIYFGDVFVDELMYIEYKLKEMVMPVYGYNSYRFDAVARGQRIVTGKFTIAFREAGFMFRLLEHIGQLKERSMPTLSYLMDSSSPSKPQWVAGLEENLDSLLNRAYSDSSSKTNAPAQSSSNAGSVQNPQVRNLNIGMTGDDVKKVQQVLVSGRSKEMYKGIEPLGTVPLKNNMARNKINGYINKGQDVIMLKFRLNTYLFDTGLMKKKLNITSDVFDVETENAVKLFQKRFTNLAIDGIVGPKTKSELTKGVSVTGEYDAPTKLCVMRFQKANGLTVDGVAGLQTQKKMGLVSSSSTQSSSPVATSPVVSGVAKSNGTAEKNYASYEAEIWGNESKISNLRKNAPYFYGQGESTALQIFGFDIYINFGPLKEAIRANNNKLPDQLPFNTTIKSIRNVQLTDVEMVLNANGEPIAETYYFIAQELD